MDEFAESIMSAAAEPFEGRRVAGCFGWLDGGPDNRGPSREDAEALARLLDTPDLVGLWWPGPDPVVAPPSVPAATVADGGTTDRRRMLAIVGGVAAVLVVLVAVGFGLWGNKLIRR